MQMFYEKFSLENIRVDFFSFLLNLVLNYDCVCDSFWVFAFSGIV